MSVCSPKLSLGLLMCLPTTQVWLSCSWDMSPSLRLPHSRAFGDGLFELRPRGRVGIGRAFYCFLVGKRMKGSVPDRLATWLVRYAWNLPVRYIT